jgi:nucleotide-binding universal stress UspA family protein
MNVLLATDGREPAAAAARLLARLARRDTTEIQVLGVNSFDAVLEAATAVGRYDPEAGQRRLQAIVDATTERLRRAGLRARSTVVDGNPATEILAASKRLGTDLVVLGAGHTRWVDTLLLGSTSTTVLHAAESSVLVVHEAGEGPVEVLVGTDGSAGAAHAVETFTRIANPDVCTVVVLAVAEGAGTAPPGSDVEEVFRAAREGAARTAADTAGVIAGAGFRVRTETAEGSPTAALLDRATEHDLVVVGSRGLSPVRRAFLGSVSDGLARRARATLVGR